MKTKELLEKRKTYETSGISFKNSETLTNYIKRELNKIQKNINLKQPIVTELSIGRVTIDKHITYYMNTVSMNSAKLDSTDKDFDMHKKNIETMMLYVLKHWQKIIELLDYYAKRYLTEAKKTNLQIVYSQEKGFGLVPSHVHVEPKFSK